jgi:hypothetical protein
VKTVADQALDEVGEGVRHLTLDLYPEPAGEHTPAQKSKKARLACFYCDEVFTSHVERREHSETTHAERSFYACEEKDCNRIFKQESNLRRHVESAHDDTEFGCLECEATFKNKQGLKDHAGLHTGDFVCLWCKEKGIEKNFTNERALKRHCTKQAHRDECSEEDWKEEWKQKKKEMKKKKKLVEEPEGSDDN